MAIFCISFRLKEDESYATRKLEIERRLESFCSGLLWGESTSFYLMESRKTAKEIVSELKTSSEFDEEIDIIFIIDVFNKIDYDYIGPIKDKNLSSILEKITISHQAYADPKSKEA